MPQFAQRFRLDLANALARRAILLQATLA